MNQFKKSDFDINARASSNFEDYSPNRFENLKLQIEEGIPDMAYGEPGQISLRKINGSHFLFCKVGIDEWKKITELTDFKLDGDTAEVNPANIFQSANETFNTASMNTLKITNVAAASSDTDTFLVLDNNEVKSRTGAQILSDIGAGSGDITGVTITTDSGGGSAASDTGGSADFSILGSNGVGVTNSGTTITATAVPGEIDHDSLNNFVANEHIDWTGASAGTIHATNYTNTTYSEATSSDAGLMSTAHHDKLDGIEASATADQTKSDIDGLAITTVGALSSGSIASGFGAIDNGSSNITTTGNGSFGELTAGAVIWERFDFAVATSTSGSYHFRDIDDTTNNAGLWDATDTDPTTFAYTNVPGQFVVPEDCTLKAMNVILSNFSSSDDVIIAIYHGTPNLDAASNTTLALAGTATTVSISTFRRAYGGSATYSVDLDAGDIVVPTFKQDSGSSKAIRGSLTLKFITR